MFRRPEPADHVLHGKVDGLNNEGQHGQRSVLLRHIHKPQKGLIMNITAKANDTNDILQTFR